jgi:hypothetical protein
VSGYLHHGWNRVYLVISGGEVAVPTTTDRTPFPTMSTGFSHADAEGDFTRQRRRQTLARIAARLRAEPDEESSTLPFEPVVDALGRRGERDLGIQTLPIGSIVGTVDRRPETFDRSFRPRSPEVRARWERVAAARRSGIDLPPIEVYRVGDIHFVLDGHHRVSVARAMGETSIEAHVREVTTTVGAGPELRLRDLDLKRHERLFHERVPLPPAMRERIAFTDEWRYAQLASLVEAWGFRASHARGELLSRRAAALAWFREEYEPVLRVLREADVGGPGTDAERYLRIAMLRYLLLYTHEWTEDVIERLLGQVRPPSSSDDTMVHEILKEMS